MADLLPSNHIKDRHNDLQIKHNQLQILELKNQNKAYQLQIEKIMEADIANIEFKIECNKKSIEELEERIKYIDKKQKNK